MSVEGEHIVGSAEPLTPEQTKVRLRELQEWGVDLSLVWASLQESPRQRLDRMLGVLAFTQELQRARRAQYPTFASIQQRNVEKVSRS